MAMSRPLLAVPATCLLWTIWYKAVLAKAAKEVKPWGSNNLAQLLSGFMHSFGSSWLNFSHNAEEIFAEGTFGEGKQYIMVWHPHGSFTIAALYFISNFWARKYPGGTPRYVCVAPLLLKIPFLSEYLILCNARSQELATFEGLLKTGATVAVQPGGLAEQVATDHQREVIYFPRNVGFIRLALKHGTPLLPVYVFGENQLYKTADWTRNVNQWLYKNFKVGSMLVLGLFGIPSTPLLPNPLMLPTPGQGLHVRWGRPVEVGPPVADASEELVQETFQRYIAELRQLFDEHKDACLPPDVAARGLEIVVRGDAPRSRL